MLVYNRSDIMLKVVICDDEFGIVNYVGNLL